MFNPAAIFTVLNGRQHPAGTPTALLAPLEDPATPSGSPWFWMVNWLKGSRQPAIWVSTYRKPWIW